MKENKHTKGQQLFFDHQAQTTPYANGLEISHAKGMYIYDKSGNSYMDLVAGVSACTLGHSHPSIIKSVNEQIERYAHVMVYGEYVQSPQYQLSKRLIEHLPKNLNCTYLVNSGTEAIEGAMKLAKRLTGRKNIVSFNNSYHGSTHGALSIMGTEEYKTKYRPLLPNCHLFDYGNFDHLECITDETAAVVVEPIQGATGFTVPPEGWLQAVREQCNATGTILIFDEIQTGFGRTGQLFALDTFNVTPDILCIAKGMGGGMPIGCFISSKENMNHLMNNPKLGHITTFGGHPVCCAASLATLETLLLEDSIVSSVSQKEMLFREHLKHPKIKEIKGKGLMLGLVLEDAKSCQKVVQKGYEQGLITFFFLFNDLTVRLSPPLIISNYEIIKACKILKSILDEI
ncbi:MAG: aspartate aminotransferase family protein [Flavobacteriales bacterium]